ncbi:MAG: hypothetical protein OQK77_01890 [Psychromonas sp.]|nr:hypothetical protein [Psychromonas sp.]
MKKKINYFKTATKPSRLFAPLCLSALLLTGCGSSNISSVPDNIDLKQNNIDTSATDTSVADTSVINTPVTDTPVTDTLVTNTPVIDTSVTDTPVANTSTIDTSILDNFFFKSVADIDTYFHQAHVNGHLPVVSDQEFYGVTFAFTGKSWLSFYIDMHKNTGDHKWIDYAETTIDYMFSRTDDKLQARNELTRLPYYQAPQAVMDAVPQRGHIGWSIAYSGGRRVELLEDGVTCKYIMKVADYILEKNIAFDRTKVNSWIDKCTAILKSHDSEFVLDRFAGDSSKTIVDGSYYYTNRDNSAALYSNPLGFNHSGNAASAMYLINKHRTEPGFTIKQQAIADFMVRNFTEVGGHYSWPYGVNQYGQPLTGVLEDVNHSTYDADFITDMYKDGYISESVMNKLLLTVPVFLTETTSAHSVDGGGSDDGGDRVSMYEGYLLPAKQLNPEVYNLILTNLINYLNNSRSSLWHAQMAAAARIANLVNLQ